MRSGRRAKENGEEKGGGGGDGEVGGMAEVAGMQNQPWLCSSCAISQHQSCQGDGGVTGE